MNDQSQPLTPPQAAALLQAMAATLRAEIEALPSDAASWHPAPGEWCVKEALGHIVEAERRGFAGRIRIILAGDEPDLDTWDQVTVEQERHDCDRDSASLLAEFLALRAASVELVNGLRKADLGRGGDHPQVGHLLVRDLLHEWVHHDRNHVRQILANLQTYVWPQMGNARRFAEID